MPRSVTLSYMDTCLSCYVLDHCNGEGELLVGVPVDGTTTVQEVIDGIWGGLSYMSYEPTDYEVKAAISAAFAARQPGEVFESSLSTDADDRASDEGPQAWFRLSWEEAIDERNAIVFDNGQAVSEGWDIFDVNQKPGGEPDYVICRDDEEAKFVDDRQALAFVLNSAFEGSAYHRDALSVHLGLEILKLDTIAEAEQ